MNVKELILKETRFSDIILDVGCGILQWLDDDKPPGTSYLGIDIYLPYLEHISGEIATIQGELPSVLALFPDNSYDVVLISDVLEHLEALPGITLLSEAKRIARRTAVLIVPVGDHSQEAHDAWGLGHNEHQKHLTNWSIDEVFQEGFTLTDSWQQSSGLMMKAVYEL